MAVLDYAGLQRYDGKIKTYTGDLIDTVVEVTDSEPSDQYNKIWVDISDDEYEIAEMSDVDELRSALMQLMQTVDATGTVVTATNAVYGMNIPKWDVEVPYVSGGLSSLEVTLCGLNLFAGDAFVRWLQGKTNVTVDTVNRTVRFPATTSASKTNIFKDNTQYTFIFAISKNTGTGSNLCVYYTDGSYTLIPAVSATNTKETVRIVSSAGKTVSSLAVRNSSGYTTCYVDESGVFEGIVSLSDFAVYKEHTKKYTFDSTYYGGTLKAIDGKLITKYDSEGTEITPTQTDVESFECSLLEGVNNFTSSKGTQSVTYYASTESAENVIYDGTIDEHTNGSVGEAISNLNNKIDLVNNTLHAELYNEPTYKTFSLTKGRYNATNQTIGSTPVLDGTAGKHCIFDVSECKDGGSFKISIASVTSNAQICSLLTGQNDVIIAVYTTYNPGGNTWLVLNPETGKYEVTYTITNNVRKVYFSIYGGSDTIDVTTRLAPITKEKVYVSSSGNDTNTGLSPNYPFATLAKAIESGAKAINILSDLYQSVTISRDIIINGNGYTIYGDTALETEEYNSILKAAYTADARITACYVDETTPLTETASGSDWKGDKYNIACYADDQKLRPVADIATCEETVNSFTWEDGYFYINATGTRFSYVVQSKIMVITGGKCVFNNVNMKHCYTNILEASSSADVEMNCCKAIGSVNLNCITGEDCTMLFKNVETAFCWNDGINPHGKGNYVLIDCYCHDCSDDGVSHHDTTNGVIIGGEFARCGKGAVASPINSAKVDIYNAYIHDNTGAYSYGIYASNSSGQAQTFRAFGCVIKNNRIGLKIVGHQLLAYGCKLSDNTTDVSTESGGTVTFLD